MKRFSIIGPGKAGSSLAGALEDAGWTLARTYCRGDELSGAAHDVDVCFIATPDAAICEVAEAMAPADALVVHLSGATPVTALGPHPRRGALHPLVALPDAARGRTVLRTAWFGLGPDEPDALLVQVAQDLSGKWFVLADTHRQLYHATAVVASNHLVALLAQVERLAEQMGAPVEPFLQLARGAFDDVERVGARNALTGPAKRGDQVTIEAHRQALGALGEGGRELELYDTLLLAVQRLAQSEAS